LVDYLIAQHVQIEEKPLLSAEENELLCLVEGDAPMGQLMRRQRWLG